MTRETGDGIWKAPSRQHIGNLETKWFALLFGLKALLGTEEQEIKIKVNVNKWLHFIQHWAPVQSFYFLKILTPRQPHNLLSSAHPNDDQCIVSKQLAEVLVLTPILLVRLHKRERVLKVVVDLLNSVLTILNLDGWWWPWQQRGKRHVAPMWVLTDINPN